MIPSTLVDDDVRYADVSDVSTYIRNKEFDSSSDPTQSEVEDLLLKASQKIDRKTKRAWRLRKIADVERDAILSHKQQSGGYRRRARTSTSWRYGTNQTRRRVMVKLPRPGVIPFSSTEGDVIEVMTRDGWNDITDEGPGRSYDHAWDLNKRTGVLRVDLAEFRSGGIHAGHVQQDPTVRVTLRYGADESGGDGLSSSVPEDITEACAKWVAADLIHGDSMGSLVTSGPENVPDQTTNAGKLFSASQNTIDEWAWEEIT